MSSSRVLLAAFAAGATLCAAPALAHVSLERAEAEAGRSYKAVLKVPHGCEGSPTHTVRIEVPEGYIGVKPMPKAGWTLRTGRGAYAQAYAFYHGATLKEGVRTVEWSGGELPDDYYDEFVLSGFLARELSPGASLYFKVVQLCAKGELAWVEIPGEGVDPHDLKAPAAKLAIAGGSAEPAAAAATGAATAGTLAIEGGWMRATAEGAKVAAGYLAIRNTGPSADRLLAIATPAAERGEIHDMSLSDEGVMRMRHLAKGLEIPAGGNVELKPGGTHLMLLGLKERLVAGGKVPVTLTFESGATITLDLPVKPLGGGGAHHHH